MNCSDIENLLPRYHEDELDADDRRRVDSHVADCVNCRESLAFFAALETSLSERRALRPAATRTAARVIGRLGLRQRSFVLRSLFNAPGLASVTLIVVGVFLLLIKNPFVELPAVLSRMGDWFSLGLSPKLASWLNEIAQVSGDGEWMLIGLYLGVFALIMLMGSWMVLRFVRD
ncbi:MAG: zf-HC2 domain-containing protein [Candidatus Latescibacterota bacterium]|nr:MAG: zf-HC2 domain-containing protein [Candidatus Latescibacterota bacterium]